MFVDASAIIAIIGGEEDGSSLAVRLAEAGAVYLSPLALYEAIAGLARKRACPIEEATVLVEEFVEETGAVIVDVTDEIGRAAIEAFRRFGRGRHKADLNMGDCFAYGCASTLGVALLCKGNDFVHTDIELA